MKAIVSKLFFLLLLGFILTSCHTRDKVVYMQGASELGPQELQSNYSPRIKKDDQLTIIVSCNDPEVAAPYNMQLTNRAFAGGSQIAYSNGGSPQIFWVDPNGEITYPSMGKVKAEGLTRWELADKIREYLTTVIKDPIVNVSFYNYKITVLGEVSRPGQFSITTDRFSIFDAIAQAGDLTIFGERDKVRLIREEDGKQVVYDIDLRDPKIVHSPMFYLHQNDILYVEPNKTKASNREVSTLYTFGISLMSLAMSIALFIRSY